MLSLVLFVLALINGSRGTSPSRLLEPSTKDFNFDPLTSQDQRPNVITKNEVVTVISGDDITLKCDVMSLGNYSVVWYKDAYILLVLKGNGDPGGYDVQHVTIDDRISNINTSLAIRNVNTNDEATYLCDVSSIPRRKVKHQLRVNVAASIRTKGIGLVESREGETAELECEVEGKPHPEVTWEKVGGLRKNTTTIDTLLTIPNVTSEDAGDYACTASNGLGEPARAIISFTVQYSPVVVPMSYVVYSGVGYQTQLECSVEGSPLPKVEWFKENAPVNPMRLRKGIERESKYFLQLKRVLRKDFGFYSCNASNYWGNDSGVIELTGRPLTPEVTSDSIGDSPYNYSLTWEVKSYSPITSFFVFLKNVTESDDEEWANVTVPGIQSSSMYHSQRYVILGLSSGAKLMAKVQANNEFGESDFSPPFTFQTTENDELFWSEEDIVVKSAVSVESKSGSLDRLNELSTDSFAPFSETNNSNSLTLLLREEETNISSQGLPSMTPWEKRSQLMSMVTAVSLSCFFYLFAMR